MISDDHGRCPECGSDHLWITEAPRSDQSDWYTCERCGHADWVDPQ